MNFVKSKMYGDQKVYRFFDQECFADDFCQGKLKISTLEACRGYEDAAQGDKGEAIHNHTIGVELIDSPQKRQSLFEIYNIIDNSIGTTIIGSQSQHKIEDAFVICTSMTFEPDKMRSSFGRYCDEISNAHAFFKAVSLHLEKKFKIIKCLYGPIQYSERSFWGFQKSSAPLGFVKPVEIYGDQQEFRFLWQPRKPKIDPFIAQIPLLRRICRRVA